MLSPKIDSHQAARTTSCCTNAQARPDALRRSSRLINKVCARLPVATASVAPHPAASQRVYLSRAHAVLQPTADPLSRWKIQTLLRFSVSAFGWRSAPLRSAAVDTVDTTRMTPLDLYLGWQRSFLTHTPRTPTLALSARPPQAHQPHGTGPRPCTADICDWVHAHKRAFEGFQSVHHI